VTVLEDSGLHVDGVTFSKLFGVAGELRLREGQAGVGQGGDEGGSHAVEWSVGAGILGMDLIEGCLERVGCVSDDLLDVLSRHAVKGVLVKLEPDRHGVPRALVVSEEAA
jgi:hypothetical protein